MRPLRHLDQMVELLPHDLGAAQHPPQNGLVDHGPQLRGVLTFQQLRPSHAQFDAALPAAALALSDAEAARLASLFETTAAGS